MKVVSPASPSIHKFGDEFIHSGLVLSEQFESTSLESNVTVIANRSTRTRLEIIKVSLVSSQIVKVEISSVMERFPRGLHLC